jgi:hypothetical protein
MSERNPERPEKAGYEKSDINVGKVALYGAGLLLGICLTGIVATVVIFKNLARENRRIPASPLYEENQVPPEPRLQVYPQLDLKKLREIEDAHLNSYGWVDRTNGVVHMPIERAMEIVLEKGLPVRPDARIEIPAAPESGKAPMPGKAAPGQSGKGGQK